MQVILYRIGTIVSELAICLTDYLERIPFTSPLILLNTPAIPIPIFLAIIAAVFNVS